jgi:hypothetical protein
VREARDANWAEEAERRITETFAGESFKNARLVVDCRATICRVDLDYSEAAVGVDAARDFGYSHPWPGQRFTTTNFETQLATSFISRENYKLPSPKSGAIEAGF